MSARGRGGLFPASRGWDSKPIDGVEVEGMGRAKGGKGERWKSERKGKEGGGERGEGGGEAGLRGSQAEVGWRVRVVLRLRSLSFIIKFIISSQRKSIENNQSRHSEIIRCRSARPGLTVRVPSMPDVILVLDILDQNSDETFGAFGGGVDGDEVDRFISPGSRWCAGGHDELTRWKRGLR